MTEAAARRYGPRCLVPRRPVPQSPLKPEPRVLPLAEHLRELVAFCERVASPLPVWNAVLLLDIKDPGVRYDRGWIVEPSVLVTVAQFSSRWDALLVAGYAWLNLSAYGLFRKSLIVGVEFPSEPAGVAPGLTSVTIPALRAIGPDLRFGRRT